jgi:IS605 OrfB family transposase
MKKKNNIKEIFGPSLDNDIALNNTITVQSKFNLCDKQHVILNKIMEHLNYCKFMYFGLSVNPSKMSKFMKKSAFTVLKTITNKTTNISKEVSVVETFKVVFCRVFGISSRQFNSIDFDIKGLIKSNKTLMEDRLISFEEQQKKKIFKKNKLKCEIEMISKSHGFSTKNTITLQLYNKKTAFLFKLQQEIDKKNTAIDQLRKKIKNNEISVCFGDRKVLNKLSSLFNNSNYNYGKYKNISHSAKESYHLAYIKAWNDSRFNQFFLLGSKDENSGNASCLFSKQSENLYTAKISIPQAVKVELGLACNQLVISNINFKHNEKEILNSLALNEQRKQKEKEYDNKLKNNDPTLLDKDNKIIPKAKYLAGFGVAISFRFIKDTFSDPNRESSSWRILASMDETKKQKSIISKKTGVIAVDINIGHFAVAELNRNRELKKAFNIDFCFSDNIQNSNKTLRKESILKSVKQIIKHAIETKKPIIIEKLDFQRKKSLMKEENTSFNGNANKRKNRILSSFAYSLIIETIKQQAYRNGIAVYEVNPAFTSQIGWLKYAKQYGISRHMAAAYVIGRRSYAIEELFDRNEQIVVNNKIKTIPLLVDRDHCENYFEYCNKNLRNFLKRQVIQNRGLSKNSTQVNKLSVISIPPLNS